MEVGSALSAFVSSHNATNAARSGRLELHSWLCEEKRR